MTCWINQSFHVPFWWSRMLQDTNYTHDMKCRGLQLRSTVLDTANIFHIIDSVRNYVGQAQVRHYQQYGFTNNYQSEVDSLKWWVCTRLAGMDANMPGNCWNVGVPNGTSFENSFTIYPNPSASEVNVGFNFGSEKNLKIELYDAIGTCVKKLDETRFYSGSNSVKINLSGYPEGIYFLKITSQTDVFTGKIIRIE
jgi:hypothetical protein